MERDFLVSLPSIVAKIKQINHYLWVIRRRSKISITFSSMKVIISVWSEPRVCLTFFVDSTQMMLQSWRFFDVKKENQKKWTSTLGCSDEGLVSLDQSRILGSYPPTSLKELTLTLTEPQPKPQT